MKKSIKSQDGKIEVKYDDVTHVCVCMSVHALLQYLLLLDEDLIKNHTCYFMSEHIDDSISAKFPVVKLKNGAGIKRRCVKIYTHLFSRVRYPFIKRSIIYAQDHGFLISLIGKGHYFLLSDGPRFLKSAMSIDTYKQRRRVRHTFRGWIERLLFGEITLYPMATGTQCEKIFLTEMEDVPVCHQKPVQVNSFTELWKKSTSSKKQFISYLFDICDRDVELLKSRPLMFMSQPIAEDFGLSDAEYVSLLSAIFSHYDHHKLIIKTHPRDKFQYQKYFPNIDVFRKPINMQLLVLYDICPQKAITIFSSSVESFPESTEVDWFGTECHPKIQVHYSEPIIPNRHYNKLIP